MSTGRVKWFDTQKGYGFIVYEGNKDIFVHFKDVAGGIESLKENDEVEFEVAEGKKGLQAVHVKKV
ncbi:cold-shock protein [Pedobacter antarcticus 4BY]|uniref:Cold-shock protein n=2 Tax=Pedobacter antarcticus TaxID=34086 RepID=A0A081PG00_9SPHI|nr:cold-shock protein [Pedobacter antarcticus]KEQ29623.1 cold-shock protein [Pedobacter antarcticus 4BY]SFE58944.1 cold shock protein (beta-ribbon, CspA family) [Pedobacter antarcticus]